MVMTTMKCLRLSVLLVPLFSTRASAVSCRDDATIKVGGTQALQHLAQLWTDVFLYENAESDDCKVERVDIGGVGYGAGAARVCGNHLIYESVDIAGMSGPFFGPQAETTNGWSYDCRANSGREALLLHIGHEGVALVSSSDTVTNCVEKHLGGGLTLAQLRWVFSSYSMEKLLETGLDPQAVPFSDQDDTTHLWSELNENCTAEEIVIASISTENLANDFLHDHLLQGTGETVRASRPFVDIESSLMYIEENDAAIAYVQLGDLLRPELRKRYESISAIGIMHEDGRPILPDAEAFNKDYYAFARSSYLGVWNDPTALTLTGPFLQYGFSKEGLKVLQDAGFWAPDEWEIVMIRTLLHLEGGVPMEDIQNSCGREHGEIAIAGSASVFSVARLWTEMYKLGCPTITINAENGGSGAGARRVCADFHTGTPVDIGLMSREWQESEGVQRTESVYDCQDGDRSRSAVKVDIAHDGITVITKKEGIAAECQEILGGFTMDQLRWLYSDYSEAQLKATGWDPSSLKNSDNNSSTHLWSELDPGCAAQEIEITGGIIGEGTSVNFVEMVLTDHANGEKIDIHRPLEEGYFQGLGFPLVAYIQMHGDCVAFISYNLYFDNQELLLAAPIKSRNGTYVLPSSETIVDDSYPMVHTVSMNLLNDEQSLLDTVPLIKFGLSHPELITATGMVPLDGEHVDEMRRRLDDALSGEAWKASSAGVANFLSPWWGMGMVGVVLNGLYIFA